MEEVKFNQLNNLYQSLKKLDLDILDKFNNNEISDSDYFLYGIHNEIVSNTLNVLVNYLAGNIESVGIDNSCRMILEAITILAMNENGDITNTQKSIYRYSYAYVDLENFKSVITKEQFQEENFKAIKADRNKCAKYIQKHFGCTFQEIPCSGVDDPCFFIKKDLNDKVEFSKMITKYFPADSEIKILYEFFSIMIHPRCEMDYDAEKATMGVRQILVDNVLEIVENYLIENQMMSPKKDASDFSSDFFNNPLLANNVHNLKEIERAFNLAMKNLCFSCGRDDWFTWFFFEKSKYLVLDMMISLSLGYTEHVIAIFKPFMEMFSVFHKINSDKDSVEFKYIKEGYWLSSRIQLTEHAKKYGLSASNRNHRIRLQTLYDKYYATRYNEIPFNKFYDHFLHNSLYFLDNSKKSFNKFVRETIEAVSFEKVQSKELMTLYKIAKDMAHASGYSFNATIGVVRVTSHQVVWATLSLIQYCLTNGLETLRTCNINIDLQSIIALLEKHKQMQLDAIEKIYKEHNDN